MRSVGLALVVSSCQPPSAPAPVPDGPPSASASGAAPPPPADVPTAHPSAEAPDPSAPSADSTPTASSAPAGPAPLAIEYQIYDHRISFTRNPPHELILDHLSVDLVVHTDPKQTLTIGSFQNQSCVPAPSYLPPVLSGLACVFNGLVGSAELVRVHGDQVRVDAVEGPDGLGAAGPARHWTAGTVTIPEGIALEDSIVDRDAQLRSGSKLPPLTIAIQKVARGARLEVGTTLVQSVVVPGWDPSGCELHVDELDMARLAFVDCLPPKGKSLLLAYVAHETAEVWLIEGDDHSTLGPPKVVGRVRIPRDRHLEVTMPGASSPSP